MGNAWLQLFLLFFPLSVVVFFRHRQGHRLVQMWVLGIDALFLLMWGGIGAMGSALPFSNQRGGGFSPLLLLFIVAMIVLGIYHGRRGKYLALHEDLLTTSRGTSWLAKVPALTALPFMTEDFIQLKIEPLLCGVLAFLVLPFSAVLTVWLAVSCLMLAGWEQLLVDEEENRFWDLVDSHNQGKWAAQAQQMMKRTGKRPPASQTGGARVVFDPQIQARWEKASHAQAAGDYIAPELPRAVPLAPSAEGI